MKHVSILNFELCLLALLHVLKDKDVLTFEHSVRVAHYSVIISKKMNYSQQEQRNIFYGALLHDIGKLGISTSVLQKPSALTLQERVDINKHPAFGEEILSLFDSFSLEIKQIVLFHHERVDGTGYPRGLKGDNIPLSAKIVAVADAFDAMTSHRSYQKDNDPRRAVREIECQIGHQFDEQPAKAFIHAFNQGIV